MSILLALDNLQTLSLRLEATDTRQTGNADVSAHAHVVVSAVADGAVRVSWILHFELDTKRMRPDESTNCRTTGDALQGQFKAWGV